ncbi:glycosyltransferase family 4 protein [Streptomyces sp. NPDC001185]|uniref:glycosyltransferase family 4 protein n=1 Tax=Streptomyces sp. NPDC001185 TaxID=3154380 RepID=UPI00331B80B5
MHGHVDALTGRKFTDRLTITPWGIPLPAAPTAQSTSGRTLRLVLAGRLDCNKATITAIEALALTRRPHHLAVIGSGSERPALAARTAEPGLTSRVHFTPFLSRTDLWARFHDHDAFVFTTRELEALCLAAVEAQAHGLPVLHSDLPGLRDIPGLAGLPYPPPDSPRLWLTPLTTSQRTHTPAGPSAPPRPPAPAATTSPPPPDSCTRSPPT